MTSATAPVNTIRIPGAEIQSGDTVYVTGRWQVLTDVRPDGDSHFRARSEIGELFANARSLYDVAAR